MATTTEQLAAPGETRIEQHEYEKDEKLPEASVDDHSSVGKANDGLEFPTEEERLTLRRVSDSIPWNAYCKFKIYL